jgi:hypothetical protein
MCPTYTSDEAMFIVEEKKYTDRQNSSLMAEKVTISIPVELKEKIDEFLEASRPEFMDMEAFILFLLSEFLSDEDEPEEDELLEKRLRALGYIE